MDSTSLPTDEETIVEQLPVSAMTEDTEAVSQSLLPPSEDPLFEEEEIEEELIIEDFTIDGICGVY